MEKIKNVLEVIKTVCSIIVAAAAAIIANI